MSSPPPATTTPGSNVTPMWGGSWPGRPPAVPPSCFSQLYGLNQCYDDIIMMQQILMKVICDMAANNPAFQKCLAEGIAASGSSVPLIGVTDGSDAQPGQVGQWLQFAVGVTYAAAVATTQIVSLGTLTAGDWDILAGFASNAFSGGAYFNPTPSLPTGFTGGTLSGSLVLATPGNPDGDWIPAAPGRALISAPALLAVSLTTNPANESTAVSTQGIFYVSCRRAR